jgi:hypothetical protein
LVEAEGLDDRGEKVLEAVGAHCGSDSQHKWGSGGWTR